MWANSLFSLRNYFPILKNFPEPDEDASKWILKPSRLRVHR